MASAVKIPTIFTAVDKYSSKVNKMARATNNFAGRSAKKLARMDRRVRKLTPSFGGLNRALGGFGAQIGGALIIGAIGNAIGKFKDFEQANANLSSVMSSATGPELQMLSSEAVRLGSTTAKTATEVVGLQEAFARLGFEAPEIAAMTEATIAGSVAMNSGLAETAELTGAMVRTFKGFSSTDAPEIMDQMVVATQRSALSFEKLQTALPIVAGAANAAGISFTQTQAILGKLSDAGIDASSSATALRNIFLEAGKQGLTHTQILEKISKSTGKLTAANDEFGKRGAVAGSVLAENLAGVEELDKVLQSAAKGQELSGAAQEAADKQLNTLNGSLTLLGSAYEGFILSMEQGNGAFGKFLKTAVKVVTEILSLASGTGKAENKLTKVEKSIRKTANTTISFMKAIGFVIGAILGMNFILKVARGALFLFNVMQGISTALQGGSAFALRGSAIAMQAYSVVTWLATTATSAMAIAMAILTSPITLIVLAILALIALVVVIIKYWNEWGAALSLFLGPIGLIISLIQSFRRNWDMIKESFATGGILEGFKAIGATIFDAVLMPLQQVLELMSKIPGVGDMASAGAKAIEELRVKMGVNTTTDESGEQLINPQEAAQESANANATENALTAPGGGVLKIENQTENDASFAGGFPGLDVLTTSTQGF